MTLTFDFDDILKQSTEFETTVDKAFEDDSTSNNEWSNYWKPTPDKAGNSTSVIRFLPAPPGEKSPFVSYYQHYFTGSNGKVYSERSLTTLKQDDPVGKYNAKLWNSGFEEDKKTASSQKRSKKYVFNILVEKDPGKPENEGKIFLYQAGPQIFNKLKEARKPEFDDVEAIQPFSITDTGASFRLKTKKKGPYLNYEDSHFGPASALYGGDVEKMRAVFEGQEVYSLAEIADVSKYKSYDELERRLAEVLEDDGYVMENAALSNNVNDSPTVEDDTSAKQVDETIVDMDDDEDSLNVFRDLAES